MTKKKKKTIKKNTVRFMINFNDQMTNYTRTGLWSSLKLHSSQFLIKDVYKLNDAHHIRAGRRGLGNHTL